MGRWIFVALVVVLALVAWAYLQRGVGRKDGNSAVEPPPIAFENTDKSVAYVGSEACRACHAEQCDSYAATAHGRSFARVEAADETLPASFHHVPSALTYDVLQAEDRLRMRERLRPGGEGDGQTLQERDVTWVLGSGRRTRMFLVEYDGYLAEAPVAHYAATAEEPAHWGMAPEYDLPVHRSFDRTVPPACLSCHAGHVERVSPDDDRLRILEAAIGCESCHGAGALHVQHWEARKGESLEGIDRTIVNPAHLTRRQSLDLCGRCHLPGTYTVSNRDRDLADWRPGLLLRDFRIRYGQKDAEWDPAKRTYEDRLRGSACFQTSDDLSCVTCHGGHPQPTAAERTAWFRAKCLGCHEETACGLEPAQRREQSPADDCTICHMPKEEAYEFHQPLTEHRIGRYAEPSPPPPPSSGRIHAEALDDVRHLSKDEQERSLALGSILLSRAPGRSQTERLDLNDEAGELIESLRIREASDPDADAAFAFILRGQNQPQRSLRIAREALGAKGLTRSGRLLALELIVDLLMTTGEFEPAAAIYEELISLRRDPRDLAGLATCSVEMGDLDRAQELIEAAIEMSPYLASLRFQAGDIHKRAGQMERARYHNKLGERIERARVR